MDKAKLNEMNKLFSGAVSNLTLALFNVDQLAKNSDSISGYTLYTKVRGSLNKTLLELKPFFIEVGKRKDTSFEIKTINKLTRDHNALLKELYSIVKSDKTLFKDVHKASLETITNFRQLVKETQKTLAKHYKTNDREMS